MNNIIHFLTNLAIDPDMKAQFAEDSARMMEAAGLPKTVQAGLTSGDKAKVTAMIADGLTTQDLIAVLGSCTMADPGPDPIPDPDPPPAPPED